MRCGRVQKRNKMRLMCNRKHEIQQVMDVSGKLFKTYQESYSPSCCDCQVVWVYVGRKEMRNEAF